MRLPVVWSPGVVVDDCQTQRWPTVKHAYGNLPSVEGASTRNGYMAHRRCAPPRQPGIRVLGPGIEALGSDGKKCLPVKCISV